MLRKRDGEDEEVSESFHSPGPVEDSRLRRKLEGEEERELQKSRLVEGELRVEGDDERELMVAIVAFTTASEARRAHCVSGLGFRVYSVANLSRQTT